MRWFPNNVKTCEFRGFSHVSPTLLHAGLRSLSFELFPFLASFQRDLEYKEIDCNNLVKSVVDCKSKTDDSRQAFEAISVFYVCGYDFTTIRL